jgi:hypothetical protein
MQYEQKIINLEVATGIILRAGVLVYTLKNVRVNR